MFFKSLEIRYEWNREFCDLLSVNTSRQRICKKKTSFCELRCLDQRIYSFSVAKRNEEKSVSITILIVGCSFILLWFYRKQLMFLGRQKLKSEIWYGCKIQRPKNVNDFNVCRFLPQIWMTGRLSKAKRLTQDDFISMRYVAKTFCCKCNQ